jgi:hypothetical protein
MCGIVGVISTLSTIKGQKYDNDICHTFDNMLWADQLRGTDGTGVMALDSENKLQIAKVAGGFNALKAHKDSGKIINFTDMNFFTIGHNRSATKGIKDNAANAHPFHEGNTCLVHNGTLHWVNQKFRDKDTKLDVDSKAATKAIDELGIKAAVNEFSGAYAFVWINAKDNSLHVLRNDQRPLGYIQTGNFVLLASEPSLAFWCAMRNNIKFEPGTKIQVFEPNKHYTWNAGELEFSVEPCERKYSYPTSGYSQGYEDEWYPAAPAHQGRVGSTTFCGDQGGRHHSSPKSTGSKGTKGKERVRLLSPHSMESPYAVGEKVTFTVTQCKRHKNLSRISIGEIINPHIGALNKHRVTGNTPMDVVDICGDGQRLEGIITAVYKTDTDYFIFDLRNIVKQPVVTSKISCHPASFVQPTPAVTPPLLPPPAEEKKESKIHDIKSGEKMVACDCCTALTPESKLVLKKRTITDTEKNVRVKMKFNVCPSCSVNLDSDMSLMAALTESHMAKLAGEIQ